ISRIGGMGVRIIQHLAFGEVVLAAESRAERQKPQTVTIGASRHVIPSVLRVTVAPRPSARGGPGGKGLKSRHGDRARLPKSWAVSGTWPVPRGSLASFRRGGWWRAPGRRRCLR